MNCKVFENNVEKINAFLDGENHIDRIDKVDTDLIAVYWYEPDPRDTLVSCEKECKKE